MAHSRSVNRDGARASAHSRSNSPYCATKTRGYGAHTELGGCPCAVICCFRFARFRPWPPAPPCRPATRRRRAPPAAAAATPAPVAQLVRSVDIPYQGFTLDNGLRVDRPRGPQGAGRRGLRLVPCRLEGRARGQDRLRASVRASDVQRLGKRARRLSSSRCSRSARPTITAPPGSTAPIISRPCRRPALERALFLESDRMGHLLGAVTQENLTNQIGVVQNEKRQGDNQPYGLVEYAQLEALFPEGHPYRHSTIGSMADLDRRQPRGRQATGSARNTAPTMRCSCSPATSTSPTARPLVEKYFGDIPRGPVK